MVHHRYADILHGFQRLRRHLTFVNSPEHDKAAVIVETRNTCFLPHVLANAACYLQDGWNLYVVHSPTNRQFVLDSLRGWNVDMIGLNVPRLSSAQYSELLMSTRFWDAFREEWVLIFQADSLFCRPVSDEFFQYGYIGAPCGPDSAVFNGGFSLRHRPLMKHAIKECRSMLPDSIEDFFFTKAAALLGARMPDFPTARRFSVESFFSEIPVGIHGTDKFYLPEDGVAAVASHLHEQLRLFATALGLPA